jgi:hypothetical protein
MNYVEVKKIFDFCVEDTRWINDTRLIPCKNSLYLKLEELMVTHKHNHQYVKCFNEIKIQLQCAEKGIVYMKTNPYIESNDDEFEKLYGDDKIKESNEFEKLYEGDDEFEKLYGNNEIKEANEFEKLYEGDDEFEKLYEEDEIKEANEFEKLYEGDDDEKLYEGDDDEKLYEGDDDEKLYEEDEIKEANIKYTKKIDLSALCQYSISIASICPIVCRL